MVKVFAFVTPKLGMSLSSFRAYWRGPHAEIVSRQLGLRRYAQAHRLDERRDQFGSECAFAGVAECWFDDLAAVRAVRSHPSYVAGTQRDEPNFLDVPALRYMVGQEQVLTSGIGTGHEGALKLVQLIDTPPGGVGAWGVDDELEIGARLGVVRHVRSFALAELYRHGVAPPYHGVRELWWPDLAALDRGRAREPHAWGALELPRSGAHAPVALLVREHWVLPGASGAPGRDRGGSEHPQEPANQPTG